MNKGYGWALVALTMLSGACWWWFSGHDAVPQLQTEAVAKPASAQVKTGAANKTQGTEVVEVKEQLPQELQQSFALVAQSYAAEVATPAYSRPLSSADTQLLAPNQFFAQTIPLTEGGSIRLEASQYRFSYPEPVQVSLISQGIELNGVQVQLLSQQNGELLASQALTGQDGRYDAVLTPQAPDQGQGWDGELEVRFVFDARGETQQLQTAIEYSQPVAEITAVGSPSPVGADLVIPLQLTVKQAGFYRLRANLFSEDGQPLAQLTATDRLSSGAEQLKLKVHKSVLAGRSGPYWLRTFVLEQMSASPAEPTRSGKSAKPEYKVEYLSLDSLSDEPAQLSDEERQRLELLQKLAGKQ